MEYNSRIQWQVRSEMRRCGNFNEVQRNACFLVYWYKCDDFSLTKRNIADKYTSADRRSDNCWMKPNFHRGFSIDIPKLLPGHPHPAPPSPNNKSYTPPPVHAQKKTPKNFLEEEKLISWRDRTNYLSHSVVKCIYCLSVILRHVYLIIISTLYL